MQSTAEKNYAQSPFSSIHIINSLTKATCSRTTPTPAKLDSGSPGLARRKNKKKQKTKNPMAGLSLLSRSS
jgi:hypothetical protein